MVSEADSHNDAMTQPSSQLYCYLLLLYYTLHYKHKDALGPILISSICAWPDLFSVYCSPLLFHSAHSLSNLFEVSGGSVSLSLKFQKNHL